MGVKGERSEGCNGGERRIKGRGDRTVVAAARTCLVGWAVGRLIGCMLGCDEGWFVG